MVLGFSVGFFRSRWRKHKSELQKSVRPPDPESWPTKKADPYGNWWLKSGFYSPVEGQVVEIYHYLRHGLGYVPSKRWFLFWISEASTVWPMDFYSCRFEVSHWHQGIGWVHGTPFLLAIGSWRIGTCRGKSQGEAWRRSRGPLEIPDFENFEIPLPIQTYWLDISSKSKEIHHARSLDVCIYIYKLYKAQNDWQILSYSNHPASLWLLFNLDHHCWHVALPTQPELRMGSWKNFWRVSPTCQAGEQLVLSCQPINEQVAASRFSSSKQKHFEDCSHRIEEETDSEKNKAADLQLSHFLVCLKFVSPLRRHRGNGKQMKEDITQVMPNGESESAQHEIVTLGWWDVKKTCEPL